MKKTKPTRLEKIKEEFRRWYASLSVTEIMNNKKLIKEIEKMEQLFSTLQPA